ncbi:CRISPR-associated helicase Cas3' [Paramuribaculum intestinale]|nr:CRISPR-associated helicase Cas3' [Paramuribaculum intestinale]
MPDLALRPPSVRLKGMEIHHVVRMLFSCLVDADYLDTEQFMDETSSRMRESYSSIVDLKERLDRYIGRFSSSAPSVVNRLRSEVQRMCEERSAMTPGVFELTVPTGGGKTVASVVWAVNHACRHGKQRIIIAIPFTSIIMQTAQVLREIFGSENVIEHHSVMSDEMINERTRLAAENWDAPIVVTTNVQLFESMFSNRPSKCRKLHSLANSVVILDEAQSLPRSFMQPVADAISTYTRVFGTSFLLCTATQPLISGCHKGCGPVEYRGIDAGDIHCITDRSMDLHEGLRRVDMRFDMCELTSDEIARRIEGHRRVLCIVNTRGIASEIYGRLRESDDNFHLSRMMCPLHIRQCLSEIRRQLDDGGDRCVRVVATQLVEAGVDLDFPVVYRQMAGLDSLLQAAGRCNREGLLENGVTHVFRMQGYMPRGTIKESIYAM